MYYTSKSVYKFISKQTSDPIVEWKICKVSGKEFAIFQSDLDFYKKISFTSNLTPNLTLKGAVEGKIPIPTPTLCPEERQRRRLMFCNEGKLYKRKCDATGENIISIYSPEKPHKIFQQDFWWSDKWDPMMELADFDSIFQKIQKLWISVPLPNLKIYSSEGCQYNNNINNSKNCYLCVNIHKGEDSLYCVSCAKPRNCVDLTDSVYCENSYWLVDCTRMYESMYCVLCEDSSNLKYCHGLKNCENCFGCVGLQHKKYHIFNKQYSPEEYEKESKRLLKLSKEIILKEIEKLSYVTKPSYIISSEESYGYYLNECSKAVLCFDSFYTHTSKYIYLAGETYSSQDIYNAKKILNNSYNGIRVSGYNLISCVECIECKDVYYCFQCHASSNLFGCVGLRNKSYCIFNKQYTKEEYFERCQMIIQKMSDDGERGEFFDPSLSPFGYNETVAQEYFPLTREEALARGYKRQDKNYDPVIPESVKVLKGDAIPKNISEVTDEILKSILMCEVSGRPFRIIKQELDFYRKHHLPIPTKHPDVRHEERMKQRPARELHLRKCDKCNTEMLSVYGGIDPEKSGLANAWELKNGGIQKVYCEVCYNKEIYG